MSLLLSESFETGSNGTAITTSNTIFDLVSGSPTISTAWSIVGTRSMDCNAAGSAQSGRVPLGSARALVPIVVYFSIVGSTTPTANTAVVVARNGATAQADVQVQTNGRLRIRNGGSQVWSASSALPTDTDLRLEWLVDVTGGTQSVAVYARHGTTPIAGQSGTAAYSGSNIDTVVLGVVNAVTYHVRLDNFAVYTLAADLPAPAASSPTVSIGASPTIQDYHAAAFTPSVSGTNGTTTYAWSVLSGQSTSSGQFSTTSAANTTFTPAGGPGDYVLRLRVHDDSGDTDATVTVTVTALLATDGCESVITSTGWTASSGTVEQVLRGEVTNGYVTSSNNPSAQPLKYQMRGIQPPVGDLTHTLRILGRSGGTGVVDLSILKIDGTTLVKKISGITAPLTPTDTAVTFLSADLTGMTAADWRAGHVALVEATAS